MCKLCSDSGKYRGMTGQENYCSCRAGRSAESEFLFSPERIAQLSRPEQIAWIIRKNLERYARRAGYKQSLQHLCGIASVALLVALKREGFAAYVAKGEVDFVNHFWVVHNRRIVDLTFTQFEANAPRVLVTKIRNGRHRQESIYRKPRRLATSFSETTWAKHVESLSSVGNND